VLLNLAFNLRIRSLLREMTKDHVITLTPNPTLDLGGIVDDLIPNEKCYVYNQTKSPGGNAINAARVLTRLGIPTVATGFLGGSIGQEIKSLLDQEGVKGKWISIKGHTRLSVIVSNKRDHQQTRLSFPGPKILTSEKKRLFNLIKADQRLAGLLIGGSLPTGFSGADIVKFIKITNKRNIRCVVDCPGRVLREVIHAKPFFIKPNLLEFQEMTGTKSERLSDVREEASKLLKFVSYVCVSSVEDGALLIGQDKAFFGRIPPEVVVRSTVGAGDSMIGAMTAQVFRGNKSVDDILKWGLAAAAATLSHQGTAAGTTQEMRRLYRRTTVEAI
jgi:1-phosphofructokinase family hexose kinase